MSLSTKIVMGQDSTTVSSGAVSGLATVLQVFMGGRHVGGSEDLRQYLLSA